MLNKKELLDKSIMLKTINCDGIWVTSKYETVQELINDLDTNNEELLNSIVMLDDEIAYIEIEGKEFTHSEFKTVNDLYEYCS